MTDTGAWALVVVLGINTLFIIGLTVALWMIHRRLASLAEKVDPLAARAAEVFARVDQLTQTVEGLALRILDQTTHLVDNVAKKVDTTTAIAEQTISQPMIGAASVMAGISRGLETYREQAEKGDSH